MAKIGYARVSTNEHDTAIQIDAHKAAGCMIIREEKASGTSTAGRKELAAILDFIRDGDTLVVTRIDQLARSIGDLQTTILQLSARGARLKATEQPIDMSTVAGKAFLRRSCGPQKLTPGRPSAESPFDAWHDDRMKYSREVRHFQ